MDYKALIIDDERTIALVLSARMRNHGFDTRTAFDGATGIDTARAFQPDCVLLDIQLPDIDGFEVLRRFRADSSLASIPVFFLTANTREATRDQAERLGVAGYFNKPYDYQQMTDSIHAVLAATPNKGSLA